MVIIMDDKKKQSVLFCGTSPQFLALSDLASKSKKVDVYRHICELRSNALKGMPIISNVIIFEIGSAFSEQDLELLQESHPEIRLIGANLSTGRITGKINNTQFDWPIAALPYEINTRSSTHKFLTRQGFQILRQDKGSSFVSNIIDSKGEKDIVDYSIWADNNEIGYPPWSGHFYSPETEKNYGGSSDPTALTRYFYHYNRAIKEFRAKEKSKTGNWRLSLGNALHYCQDITAPFHAANDATSFFDWDHSNFEKLAEECHDNYKLEKNGDCYFAPRIDAHTMLRQVAFAALDIYRGCHLGDRKDQWYEGINQGLRWGQRLTAGVLHSFILDVTDRLPK